MPNKQKCLLSLLFALTQTASGMPDAQAEGQEAVKKPTEFTILRFPGKGKIGDVGIIGDSDRFDGKHAPAKTKVEALGSVPVPRGAKLYFKSRDFMGLEKPLDIIQTFPVESLYSLDLSNNIIEEKELPKVLKFQNLRRLELGGTDFADSGLRILVKLPNLEAIAADHTRTTGGFLVDFAASKRLIYLALNHNDIDPKYLKALPNFTHLHWLDLSNTHLKDSAAADISACSEIEVLKIDDNNDLSDKFLIPLKSLKHLRKIYLENTKITNRGLLMLKGAPLQYIRINKSKDDAKDIAELKKVFPKLEVVYQTMQEKSYKIYKDAFE